MKTIKWIMMGLGFSAFVACNMDNADNPSNSAPSSDTTAYEQADMNTSMPVTTQMDSLGLDSMAPDTLNTR